MHKISICGIDNCNNKDNNFDNCEDFIGLRIGNIDFIHLELLYRKYLKKYSLTSIMSSTLINGKQAQEVLFEEIIHDFFGCKNLSLVMKEISRLNNNLPCATSKETIVKYKSKIGVVLFGKRKNFQRLLELSREFDSKYKTDIFINVLVKLDSIYKISDYH